MHPPTLHSYKPIWQNLLALRNELPQFYMDGLRSAVVAQDLAELPLGMLIHAYDMHPTPLTADIIKTCVPYYNTPPFTERLVKIAEAGLFQSPEPDHYLLTDDAYQRVDAVYQGIYVDLGKLEFVAEADLDWLVTVFQGILERSFASNYPTPNADMEYKPRRTQAIAPFAQFAAMIDVLFNFRCDSHQAAWRDLGISAPAIEVWTVMWREQADTVQGVMDVLAADFPRGYSVTDYQTFTAELLAHGLVVAKQDNTYRLTDAGQAQRDAIETQTDALFFAPWTALSKTDIERLAALTQKFLAEIKE